VKVEAQRHGIPVYQPDSLRSEAEAAPLRQWRPDIIIVVAFGQILRPHVLDMPPLGCLNVHASLLPRWRGASPIQHAILAGDASTGVTLMQLDAGMDTGPIFAQRAIPIRAAETAATLHDRLARLGATMLAECLDDILNGHLTAMPQDNSLATYAPLIKKGDGQLDWQRTAVELERHLRAMTPWPGAFTTWRGKSLSLLRAELATGSLPAEEPGRVIPYRDGAAVMAGKGALVLQELQLEGKKAMAVTEFIRGRPDFMGSKLGA
jgi:methionyl-tRNA formyltransferase